MATTEVLPPVAEVLPPVAEVETTSVSGRTEFGKEWTDDYFYFQNRKDPRTIPYLEAENEYYQTRIGHLADLRQELYDDILGRIVEDDSQAPVQRGDHFYYRKTVTGQPYDIYCRKSVATGEEEIILDCNELAQGFDFFSLGVYTISPDCSCICYGTDTEGNERYTLHFKNLETKEDFGNQFENCSGATFDNQGNIFFTRNNEAWRSNQLFRASIEDENSEETLVMQEDDDKFGIRPKRSRDGRFLLIHVGSNITDEIWYLPTNASEQEPVCLFPRVEEIEVSADFHGDYVYYLTNDNNCKNFELRRKLISGDEEILRRNILNCVDNCVILHHDENITLEGFTIFENYIVIEERSSGLSQVRFLTVPGDVIQFHETYIFTEDESYVIWVSDASQNPNFNTNIVRIGYETPKQAETIYDYNMETNEKVLVKQKPVANFDSGDYKVERIFARGFDGVEIPITVLSLKDQDDCAPLYLEGYGSYGYSNDFVFWNSIIGLVNRGVRVAQAHIRGGGEYGRNWKLDGKLYKKQNTFLDFVSCAEHLIFKNYTTADQLVCFGRSAGGLLIGATVNMRPELFAGAILEVPFVDIINTISDETIPLTCNEWDEWGNPKRSEEEFEYIARYDPYLNIRPQKYPRLYVCSSINDTRVLFHEPTKYTAKMRHVNPETDIIMHMDLIGGHGGKSGRYGKIEQEARKLAWVLDVMGKST